MPPRGGDGPRFGFPQAARLRRSEDFAAVFRRGRKVTGDHFVCYAAFRADEPGRLGMGVSKKTGNAVARNRIKRRIRECYRHCRPLLRPGHQLVVLARPGAARLAHEAAVAELEALFRRGGAFGE